MEQRSQEWFDARKGRITGSRVGAVIGHNQYQTRDDLMREMVREWFDAPREFTGNDATNYGTVMEPHALEAYKLATGNEVREEGLIVHPDYDFIGVSPDGLIEHVGGLEIKCPYYTGPYSVFDKKKKSYYAQVQLVMWACGLEWMDFFSYVPEDEYLEGLNLRSGRRVVFEDHDYILENVLPDMKWREMALPKIVKFREDFLKEIDDPELYTRHLLPPGNHNQLPSSADPRLEELAKLHAEIEANKVLMIDKIKRFDTLKKELCEDFGGSVHGSGIIVKQTTSKGAVDWKVFMEAVNDKVTLETYGLDPEDYRKADTNSYKVMAA